MILDEPTTYLDIESPKVLERLLRENSGGFMLVNRDRGLISKFTDEICDIDATVLDAFLTKPCQLRRSEDDVSQSTGFAAC